MPTWTAVPECPECGNIMAPVDDGYECIECDEFYENEDEDD